METNLGHTARENVVSTEFDGGEGVLVDLNTKRYYQLNETAMLIWRRLEKGDSFQGIVEALTAEFDVTSEHAAKSVKATLEKLQSHRLISKV